MQSLEEDALLKGTLSMQDFGSSSSSPVKPKENTRSENGTNGGEALTAGAGGSQNGGAPCGGQGADAEEPQTDGDETDDYSDQVLTRPHDGEPSLFSALAGFAQTRTHYLRPLGTDCWELRKSQSTSLVSMCSNHRLRREACNE